MEVAEFYDSNKKYIKIDGEEYNEQTIVEDFPSIKSDGIVVFVEGMTRVVIYTAPLDYLLHKYNIPESLKTDEMLMQITLAVNDDKTESTPLERIAAALEFLVLQSMPNVGDKNEF